MHPVADSSRLDRHGRADGVGRDGRRALRRRPLDLAEEPDFTEVADSPCHTGLVLHSIEGLRAGPGHAGQAGAARARRPRGVRAARPLGRAAHRARPAARPGGRHRLARRPGRHRQVRAGAVRRAGGRARAARAQAGRRVPAAVRRRRPGARLPAGQREREDGALGAGRLRHARRARLRRRHGRGDRPRACSRCCR